MQLIFNIINGKFNLIISKKESGAMKVYALDPLSPLTQTFLELWDTSFYIISEIRKIQDFQYWVHS